ncbi:hypothetical protein JXB12_12135 [candidate division KSB1 bacterium]|nr:hypothetical protein [candidate division KSB1 bacterium]
MHEHALDFLSSYWDRSSKEIAEDYRLVKEHFSADTLRKRVQVFFAKFFHGGHDKLSMTEFNTVFNDIVWLAFVFFSKELGYNPFVNIFFISPYRAPYEDIDYDFIQDVTHRFLFEEDGGIYEFIRNDTLSIFEIILNPSHQQSNWSAVPFCFQRNDSHTLWSDTGNGIFNVSIKGLFDEDAVCSLRHRLTFLWLKERTSAFPAIEKQIKLFIRKELNKDVAERALITLGSITHKPEIIKSDNLEKLATTILILQLHDSFWNFYYYLPFNMIPGKAIGSIAIATKLPLAKNVIKFFHNFVSTFISTFEFIEHEKIMTRHALRSALAAIMARNMSHNIGSHVLANLVQDGWKKADMQKFLHYMQQRMDFVAHISTSSPSWCLSICFHKLLDRFARNTCLLDNIARFQQFELKHFEIGLTWYSREMCRPEGKVIYLWEYGWLSFEQEWDEQKKKWRTLEDKSHFVPPQVDIAHADVGAHAFYSILENLLRNSCRYGNREWLESIRKGEKIKIPYKDNQQVPKARFALDVYEDWNDSIKGWKSDYYKVCITDHIPTSKFLEINENGKKIKKETTDVLQSYLDKPIIKETGELEQKYWGMKEIKISASYLRLIRSEDIDKHYADWNDGKGEKPPIIRVDWYQTWDEKQKSKENTIDMKKHLSLGKLRYSLFLFKPKQVFIVSPSTSTRIQDKEAWLRHGMEFSENGILEFRRRVEEGDVLRHNFLVLETSQMQVGDWIWLVNHMSQLPYRIVLLGDFPKQFDISDSLKNRWKKIETTIRKNSVVIKDVLNMENAQTLLLQLWKIWVNSKWEHFKICVRWKLYQKWHSEILAVIPEDAKENHCKVNESYIAFDHQSDKQDHSDFYMHSAYHQAISGGQSMATLLLKAQTECDEKILFKIKEAASVSVGILDERIAERGNENVGPIEGINKYSDDAKKLKTLWGKRRVYILDIEAAITNFLTFVENLKTDSTHNTDDTVYDFFIIHQGIIDDAKKTDNTGSERFEQGWQLLKKKVHWIIIDTGRGKPDRAREENLRWMEYSNLAEYTINKAGDKFSLVQMLFALQAEMTKYGGNV